MKKHLSHMRITPSKNGGHTVTHSFKSMPRYSKTGGMGMDHPPDEEHKFGAGDGAKMMQHIKKHLGMSGMAGDDKTE